MAQGLIINRHDVALFDSIPVEYKQAASSLRMMFMDRSVGYNISTYLDCLSQPHASAPSYCKRTGHQDSTYNVDPSEVYWSSTWPRDHWQYRFWPDGCSEDVTCFIDYIDDRLDSFDILGCQFSYLAVSSGAPIADTLTGFFGSEGDDNKALTYAHFAADHPDKKLIWWTTSLARGIGTPESESFNRQMREYAEEHDVILFDVADILAHDPGGEPCYDNRDGVIYKDENHPDDDELIPAICPHYTTETEGGHLGSVSAGGIRVSKAMWVLMARLAGWKGATTSIDDHGKRTFTIIPNPAVDEACLYFVKSNLNVDEVVIMDITGSKVLIYQKNDFSTLTDNTLCFPLRDLMPGIYFVRIRTGDEIDSGRLVVRD
jgi:hypothetical protein